jgi:CSLREA domain-containing protein
MSVLVRTFRSSSHVLFTALLAVASLGLLALSPAPAHGQNTYVVDSNGDAVDANPGDGTCATAGGDCTLRAAIQEANQTTNNDNIEFSLPTTGSFATITPSEEFQITEPVTIDGTTSPEYPSSLDGPAIVLDGSSLSSSLEDGIEVNASNVTVNGLGINNFPDDGIQVFSGSNNVAIQNCFIGIAIDDGESDRGNHTSPDSGINAGVILSGDNFTLENNVISHNGADGVHIAGSGTGGGNLAIVSGNYVGLDHNGDAAAGNEGAGMRLAGGSGVLLGFGENYIGSNTGSGVVVESGGHDVLNNHIGTGPDGTSEFGNGGSGIQVLADNTNISSNLVSGNDLNGITIGDGNTSADGLTIENNTIGLNDAGDATLPNGTDNSTSGGLVCNRSSSIGSGSTTTVSGNTIAGNAGQGMWITENCFDWDILDNYVGTNFNYATGLGNNFDGVQVKSNPADNDGEVEVVENIIGSNSNDGVDIRGSYHDVANNYIGVAPDNSNIANLGRGVVIDGTGASLTSVFIGGTAGIPGNGDAIGEPTPDGNGNVVGFNGPTFFLSNSGIRVEGEASEFVIAENYVGTNPDGADFGNVGAGIRITGGASSSGHDIGYGPADPISSPDPANGGDGNVVAYNTTQGIVVGTDASATDVSNTSVRGNIVYQNGDADNMDIGIDLGGDGVTANDNSGDDADTGPNNLQNFPIIEDVTYDESNDNVSISYRVQTTTSNAAYPLTIDFYAADSEQSGEGQTYIGSQEYTSGDARSSVTNVIDLSSFSDITSDDHFVATATDANGNTSEFVSTAEELPVELATFEGTQTGASSVELRWTTASEQNNAGFRVQHKAADDNSWQKLGFVESKADGGTTSDARTYRFSTEDLAAGTHQFRLKQMDLDGTPHTHEAIPVEVQMQQPLQLSAPAPHPVQSRATLSFAVKEKQETTLRLYNTLGQRVATLYRGTPTAGETQTIQLSATDLTSGTYFLRLQTGERTRTQRVTVVR